ncbi:MAG: hypothetical protein LBN74_02840, partial [Prevotella sp.]|nr:hypothetical protein [Prevotella sp.]
MNMEEKDELRSLFHKMKLDEPSADFESRLMRQVYAIAERKSRKQSIITVLSIICGIAGMLGIPALIFWYLDLKPNLKPISTDFNITIPT